MVKVDIKGVHSVTRRLADGTLRTYRYLRIGDERRPLTGEPGSAEFLESYAAARRDIEGIAVDPGTLAGLIEAYRRSEAYTNLSLKSKADYGRHLDSLAVEFGKVPLRAISRDFKSMRAHLKRWRRQYADRPRTADWAWNVAKRLFSWAIDEGLLTDNPAQAGGRWYHANRQDRIWRDEDIARFCAVAPGTLVLALRLALATGLRQGDLLRLTWADFDGERIRTQTQKRGRRVSILLDEDTRAQLTEARAGTGSTHILVSDWGRPWSQDGFRTAWRRSCARAGIEGLTFHDLRRTAVTRAAEGGASVTELASRFGWSLKDVEAMLEHHYLADSQRLGDAVVHRLSEVKR